MPVVRKMSYLTIPLGVMLHYRMTIALTRGFMWLLRNREADMCWAVPDGIVKAYSVEGYAGKDDQPGF